MSQQMEKKRDKKDKPLAPIQYVLPDSVSSYVLGLADKFIPKMEELFNLEWFYQTTIGKLFELIYSMFMLIASVFAIIMACILIFGIGYLVCFKFMFFIFPNHPKSALYMVEHMTQRQKTQYFDDLNSSLLSRIQSPVAAFRSAERLKLPFPFSKIFAEAIKNPFYHAQEENMNIYDSFGREETKPSQHYSYNTLHQFLFYFMYVYAIFLLFGIVWNYFQVMFTNPGQVPDSWIKEEKKKRKLERKHTKLSRRWGWINQNKKHADVLSLQTVLFELWTQLSAENAEVEQILAKFRDERAKKQEKTVKIEGEEEEEERVVAISKEQTDQMEQIIKSLDDAKSKQFLILFQALNPEFPVVEICIKQISEWEGAHKDDKTIIGKHWSTFCSRCENPKPARTHHCSACHKCVIKMDHHCPWIFNCVGLNNHRFFLGFLFYNLLACVSIAFLSIAAYSGFLPVYQEVYEAWQGTIFLVFTITLMMSPVLIGFFAWHFYLVSSNQTTIEFQFNKFQQFDIAGRIRELVDDNYQTKGFFAKVNEYDLGIKENLRQCFGVGFRQIRILPNFILFNIFEDMISWCIWACEAVLPIKRKLPCNGLNFPKNPHMVSTSEKKTN